jgi:hypothetical protein
LCIAILQVEAAIPLSMSTELNHEQSMQQFLAHYDDAVIQKATAMRQLLLAHLPNVIEQIDLPAKMIAYCYGQRYVDVICVLFPSKKGLKISFNRGTQLADPEGLLQGSSTIARFVPLHSDAIIQSKALLALIKTALKAYQKEIKS